MGSGKHLKRAMRKYGISVFEKCVLFIYDTEDKMNEKEKELVTEEFCKRDDTYNICEGGKGGFGYLNSSGTINYKKRGSVGGKISGRYVFENRIGMFDFDNEDIKIKRKNTRELTIKTKPNLFAGKNNPQYGTRWITNGKINRKIKKNEDLPIGFKYGRIKS